MFHSGSHSHTDDRPRGSGGGHNHLRSREAHLRNFKGTLGAGIASVSLLVFTFIRIQMKMAAMQADMQQKLAGNPFRGLAEATMGSIQFEWGWGVLLVGGGLMIAAGLVRSVVGRRNCPHCAGQILVAASTCRFCGRALVPVGVTTVEAHENPLLKPIHVSDRVRKWIGIACYLPGIVAVGLVVFISFFSTPTERWGHIVIVTLILAVAGFVMRILLREYVRNDRIRVERLRTKK